jgi:thiosulfate/3-mercaptopyruvate sulfurtransferase
VSLPPLVDCATLAAHLADPAWRVFDCRHQLADPAAGERAYLAGHLPGARFLHLDRDLSGPLTGTNGRHPLPDPRRLAATLAAAGVTRDCRVVAYDDAGGAFASRLWWLLRWLGHDEVAVLDGGIQAWRSAGGTLETRVPPALDAAAASAPDPVLRAGVVDAGTLAAELEACTCCLIDARSPDRFRGENETLDPVGGHIPGARNRFFRDNLDSDGRFRPAAELRREFLALLAGAASTDAVLYCGSGVTACHNLLAMEVAGLQGARLYAGSWSEWCSDPARPIARQTV